MRPITFDIKEMIDLFSSGKWNYSELGKRYNKDHTTIIYHCQKLGLAKSRPVPPELADRAFFIQEPEEEYSDMPNRPVVIPKYEHILIEKKVNPGKSYKQYLAEALKRPIEAAYQKRYHIRYANPKIGRHSLAALLENEDRSEDDSESALMVSQQRSRQLPHRNKGHREKQNTRVGIITASKGRTQGF